MATIPPLIITDNSKKCSVQKKCKRKLQPIQYIYIYMKNTMKDNNYL